MPTRNGGRLNAHTVDERIDMYTHIEALSFYYDLIRNFDASTVAATDKKQDGDRKTGIDEL
jgi:Gly-Xaa carboxypeptidase